MYNVTLKILYPDNSQIEPAMKNLKQREHFSYNLKKYINLRTEDIKESDILLAFYSSDFKAEELRNLMKLNTTLILILEHNVITDNDALFNFADDIWFTPISEKEVSFRMEKIIERINLKKDKILAENYLNTLINSIPDMVWFKDNAGIHLKVNDAFCNIIGKSREKIEDRITLLYGIFQDLNMKKVDISAWRVKKMFAKLEKL